MSSTPKTHRKFVTLDFCRGFTAGKAIYLNIHDSEGGMESGHRVAGPKCYGFIQTVAAFELSENDLDDLIREAKAAKRLLQVRPKRPTSKV